MEIKCGVPGADRLPPAYRRAINLRADLGRAVGLYSIGDRSDIVLKTLALGRLAYHAIGAKVPVPGNVKPDQWQTILDALVERYGLRPFDDESHAA